MCGIVVLNSRWALRVLARWISRKLRCRPSRLTNGLTALTTPAPVVHRLPTPAASVTTATSPRRKADSPRPIAAAAIGFGRLDQLGVVDIANVEVDRQPVACQADPAALEVVAQLFVLDRVEAIVAADAGCLGVPFGPRDIVGRPRDREKMIDGRAENAQQLAGLRASVGEVVDVGPAMVGKRSSALRRSSAEPGSCSKAGASSPACQRRAWRTCRGR